MRLSLNARLGASLLVAAGVAMASLLGAGTAAASRALPAHASAQPSAERIQQAIAQCRARGSQSEGDFRRCVERRVGVSLPSDVPGLNSGQANSGQGNSGQSNSGQGSNEQPQQPAPPPTPVSTSTPVARGPVVTDRGIVQTVAPDSLVLRALDGSSITIALDGRTRFYLGDRSGSLSDVQPGGVATVRHQGSAPAVDVRVALPPKPQLRSDRGLTTSGSATSLVMQLADGTALTIRIDGSTRVYGSNGRQVSFGELRPGLLVDVVYDPSGSLPAQTVKIIRR